EMIGHALPWPERMSGGSRAARGLVGTAAVIGQSVGGSRKRWPSASAIGTPVRPDRLHHPGDELVDSRRAKQGQRVTTGGTSGMGPAASAITPQSRANASTPQVRMT